MHTHILPGLDDGARSWEESLEMARALGKQGVTQIIATPHFRLSSPTSSFSMIREKLTELQLILIENKIPISLHQGAEVELEFEIIDYIENSSSTDEIFLEGMGGGTGRFLLLHFPLTTIPPFIDDFIFLMLRKGIIPVLAHPERNCEVCRDLSILEKLVKMGALVQVNSGSIVGAYSAQIKKTAEKIIEENLAHFIASDCHRPKGIRYKEALQTAARIHSGLGEFVTANKEA